LTRFQQKSLSHKKSRPNRKNKRKRKRVVQTKTTEGKQKHLKEEKRRPSLLGVCARLNQSGDSDGQSDRSADGDATGAVRAVFVQIHLPSRQAGVHLCSGAKESRERAKESVPAATGLSALVWVGHRLEPIEAILAVVNRTGNPEARQQRIAAEGRVSAFVIETSENGFGRFGKRNETVEHAGV